LAGESFPIFCREHIAGSQLKIRRPNEHPGVIKRKKWNAAGRTELTNAEFEMIAAQKEVGDFLLEEGKLTEQQLEQVGVDSVG